MCARDRVAGHPAVKCRRVPVGEWSPVTLRLQGLGTGAACCEAPSSLRSICMRGALPSRFVRGGPGAGRACGSQSQSSESGHVGLLRAQQRRSRGGGDTASLLRCVPGSVLTPCLLSTWLSGSLLRSLSPQGGVAPRASVGIPLPLAGVEASEIARQEGDARHRGHLLRICLPRLSVLSACPNPGLRSSLKPVLASRWFPAVSTSLFLCQPAVQSSRACGSFANSSRKHLT